MQVGRCEYFLEVNIVIMWELLFNFRLIVICKVVVLLIKDEREYFNRIYI